MKAIPVLIVLTAVFLLASPSPAAERVRVDAALKAMSVTLEGERLYLADGAAIKIYDVSAPLAPRRIGGISSGLAPIRQLAVRDGIGYASCRGQGVWIVDLRDPQACRVLSRYDSIELATGIDVVGSVCFVGHRQNGVEFVDVSDPAHPRHIANRRTDECQSCRYADGYLYSGDWGGGYVTVFDARDLRDIRQTARVDLGGFGDGLTVDRTRRLLFASTGHDARHRDVTGAAAEGRGRGVDVFSLENPAEPRHLARLDFPAMRERLHDWWLCRVSGDRLYACDSHNGFFTVDVSDPRAPRLVGRETFRPENPDWPSDCVSSCAVGDGCVYVAVNGRGGEGGLWVVRDEQARRTDDARGTAPAHPEFRETPPTPARDFAAWIPPVRGQVRALAVVGDFAFVACGDAGLWRVELADDGFGEAERLNARPVMDVVVDAEGRLATAEGLDGLALYELGPTGALAEVRRIPPAYGLAEIYVWRLGRYLVGSARHGGMRFYDLDRPSETRPAFTSKGDAGWEKYAPNAVFGGRYAVVNEGYGGVDWIDLSGPRPAYANRTVLNRIGPSRGLCRVDDETALACFGSGYRLLSPNEPETGRWKPTRLPSRASSGQPSSDGRTLCKTYRISGYVALYDLSDRAAPKCQGEWMLGGFPSAAAFWRGRVLIPCGYQGLLLRRKARQEEPARIYPDPSVRCGRSGAGTPWPGWSFAFAAGPRDFSDCGTLAVTVSNHSARAERIYLTIRTGAKQGRDPSVTGTVAPGKACELRLWLKNQPWRLDQPVELTGMRGFPTAGGAGSSYDLSRVSELIVCAGGSGRLPEVDVLGISVTRDGVVPKVLKAETFFPFVDRFGQFRHDDWLGKVKDEAELRRRGEEEERDLAAADSAIGAADRWGGWAEGPKLAATGHFRVEKVDGRWWFVDPDGHLFFSHGVCHVKPENAGPVKGRERYFEEPCGDFNVANLRRRHGKDWRRKWVSVTARRLRSWGFNTTGDWSDPGLERAHAVPYTGYFKTAGATDLKIVRSWWGSMRDPFAPDFEPVLRKNAQRLVEANAHEDPWCLGWFVDNELDFGKDVYALADSALAAPDGQPAKAAYLAFLAERGVDPKGTVPEKVRRAFSRQILERYYATVAAVVRELAPKKLYLGSRIARGNDDVWEIAARHCDVVSVNQYSTVPAVEAPPTAEDRPYLVGEFHFGAMDRGMFSPGLGVSSDQLDRARRYREYVEAAVDDPKFVGVHWFQWQDQPLCGRMDGENYNIGFVNVADDPYREMVTAARTVAAGLYARRSARRDPARVRGPFRTPPVGWMTWYAVKFGASEETILANARAFKEKFGAYLEERPVLWVDWEWYHREFTSSGKDGEDAFTPHAAAYPRGLGFLHDELERMGYTPALWIAPNAEGRTNALLKANREWILESAPYWCGHLTCNPTAPGFFDGYMRRALSLYRSWGYRVFKWDVMPHTYRALKRHRELLAARGYTPESAFRAFVADCRRAMGEDAYFLYCHNQGDDFEEVLGDSLRELDASRVGGDIFGWGEFVGNGLDNLVKFLPRQGDAFWPDCDNLVLRPEFSTTAQARTRVTIYALLGLPLTVGDPVDRLDDERTAMLRQAMPVVPTWRERRTVPARREGDAFDLAVDFGDWEVRSFANLSTNAVRQVAFATGGRAVWDIWNRRLLADGSVATLRAEVAPGDTLLVRLTPLPADGSAVEVGNDRHLTQVVPAGTPSASFRRYLLDHGRLNVSPCR